MNQEPDLKLVILAVASVIIGLYVAIKKLKEG